MMFRNLDDLVASAIGLGPARIAVAAGHDPDVIESLQLAREMGLAESVLVGDRKKIEPMAAAAGLRLGSGQLIHQPDESAAALQAIGLVRDGAADLLMKGKINTSVLIRAVLNREKGLRTGRQLSQVIVFQVPGIDRLMIMTDAAINLAPELAQKAEICRNAMHVAHALGIEEPNVALLCALEFVNPAMPATVDAAALTMMNRRGQLKGGLRGGSHRPGRPHEPVCGRPKRDRDTTGREHGRLHRSRYRSRQHSLPGHSLHGRRGIGRNRGRGQGPLDTPLPG